MNADHLSPEIETNLARLRAAGDRDIDLTDMPETTNWPNSERGRWHDFGATVALDPNIADWFGRHGPDGVDFPARVNRALRDWMAQAERKAA